MIQYITTVEDNSIFYGITRTNLLRSVNYSNFLGNDWMIVLGLLFQGKAKQIKMCTFTEILEVRVKVLKIL